MQQHTGACVQLNAFVWTLSCPPPFTQTHTTALHTCLTHTHTTGYIQRVQKSESGKFINLSIIRTFEEFEQFTAKKIFYSSLFLFCFPVQISEHSKIKIHLFKAVVRNFFVFKIYKINIISEYIMSPFSKPCFWLVLNHYRTPIIRFYIQTISDWYWRNRCSVARYLRDSS